ncbi:hypothetical protein EDD21DRAFT_371758 [Dissophora ornata]|nr:hypothetical protein EDD21DRAFT_371758 [Dissophora ornata]
MDEETTADACIAFAAIPINQVVHAPGGTLNGVFDVYTTDGKHNGELNLTLTVQNVPGQNAGYQAAGSPVKGESHIVEAHQKRMKSIKNKEIAADAGMAVVGGLFALGAGLLANKVIGDEKKKEAARKEAAYEAEVEHDQLESEKKKLEEERSSFQRTQAEERSKLEREQQEFRSTQDREEHREERREERHGEHHGEHHNKHGHGCEWDPVGNYSAGDKVRYHGREYICLQAHQSNPTWEPTQAHSLWRAD